MGHRLPTILGKAIDDVILTLNQEYDEDRVLDLIKCIERMDNLKNDLQEHAKLRPIIDDGEADVALWNKEIAKYFQGLSRRTSSVTSGISVIVRHILNMATSLPFLDAGVRLSLPPFRGF